jgi:hypothetical protein
MLKPIASALATIFSVVASAACAAQGVNLSLGEGVADISVDAGTAASNGTGGEDAWLTELSVGYLFANNVLIEGSATTGFSITAFFGADTYEFKENRLMAGYAFRVTDKFRIVPTLGVSFWDLETIEGLFLVPTARRTTSGTDVTWRLTGEYYFAPRFGVYFSYAETRPDFGNVSLPSFGLRVQF